MKNLKSGTKIYIIIGTRAQLLKMVPVMHCLNKENVPYLLIFTGQHQETMFSILKIFRIKNPDIILCNSKKDIVSVKKIIYWFFYCLFKIKSIPSSKNGVALIHGDTPSTLLGAIICKIKKIKIIHIEAGLKSNNFFHPFPEELIRFIVTKMADYYLAQNSVAMRNLDKYDKPKYNLRANTILDTFKMTENNKKINNFCSPEKYCVVTIHRFENIFLKK